MSRRGADETPATRDSLVILDKPISMGLSWLSMANPARNLDFDVAIVGYGPVGQALAALLGRAGHRVGVFERFGEDLPASSRRPPRSRDHAFAAGAWTGRGARRGDDRDERFDPYAL